MVENNGFTDLNGNLWQTVFFHAVSKILLKKFKYIARDDLRAL